MECTVADYKKVIEAIEYVQEIRELLPGEGLTVTEDVREGILFNVRTAVELLNEVLDSEED